MKTKLIIGMFFIGVSLMLMIPLHLNAGGNESAHGGDYNELMRRLNIQNTPDLKYLINFRTAGMDAYNDLFKHITCNYIVYDNKGDRILLEHVEQFKEVLDNVTDMRRFTNPNAVQLFGVQDTLSKTFENNNGELETREVTAKNYPKNYPDGLSIEISRDHMNKMSLMDSIASTKLLKGIVMHEIFSLMGKENEEHDTAVALLDSLNRQLDNCKKCTWLNGAPRPAVKLPYGIGGKLSLRVTITTELKSKDALPSYNSNATTIGGYIYDENGQNPQKVGEIGAGRLRYNWPSWNKESRFKETFILTSDALSLRNKIIYIQGYQSTAYRSDIVTFTFDFLNDEGVSILENPYIYYEGDFDVFPFITSFRIK